MSQISLSEHSLERLYMPKVTPGSWYGASKELLCKTLELPWLNNAHNISCIPEDWYELRKMAPGIAGRNYGYFRFKNVAGRSMNIPLGMSTILVHRVGKVTDLKGCVGVGSRHVDFNNDGVVDMADSGKKLQWMYDNFPDAFMLQIKKKPV